MPCLHNTCAIGLDGSANHIQLSGSETVIPGQPKRIEPEFAGAILALHMNVRRLIAVEAREEEPIRPENTLDSWHLEALPQAALQTISAL
jgi:hypothetical protein